MYLAFTNEEVQMKKILLSALVLAFGVTAIGQDKHVPDPNFVKSAPFEVALVKKTDMSAPSEEWYATMGNTYTVHKPGVDVNKDAFADAKKRANDEYQQMMENGGVPLAPTTTTAAVCSLGLNWQTNPYDGGVPSDNGIAVSDSGYVVTTANSTIRAYKIGSTVATVSKTLNSFVGISSSAFTYDPKVTYDPVNRRFVVVFLKGFQSTDSYVYVAFSDYEDPSKTWNVYAINATFGGTVWTDFPQIGLSTTELFISGNKFTDGGSSQGATLWQMETADGYAGLSSVTTVNHNSSSVDSYFSLHPVQGGSSLYGPHFYLISNTTGPISTSSTIRIHKMSNTIAAGGTIGSPTSITTSPSYALSPDADQSGTTMNLNTNDCRIQDSFLENSKIEFVFNTSNSSTPSVYWGSIKLSPLGLSFSSCTGRVINLGSSGYHLGFPGISYSGEYSSSTDLNGVFLALNYSGPSKFPGIGAMYCDTDGNLTDLLSVKTSSYINTGGSSPHRWGDYAQSAERPGSIGEAWVVGTFGSSSTHAPISYIGQIFKPVVTGTEETVTVENQMMVFPNPALDYVRFTFPVVDGGNYQVNVYDATGKLVQNVQNGRLRTGDGVVQFVTTYLSNGTYIVKVENDKGTAMSQQFIVAH